MEEGIAAARASRSTGSRRAFGEHFQSPSPRVRQSLVWLSIVTVKGPALRAMVATSPTTESLDWSNAQTSRPGTSSIAFPEPSATSARHNSSNEAAAPPGRPADVQPQLRACCTWPHPWHRHWNDIWRNRSTVTRRRTAGRTYARKDSCSIVLSRSSSMGDSVHG
eukprot:scaffold2651_cov118-Isochrysis_galbana.AAC.6